MKESPRNLASLNSVTPSPIDDFQCRQTVFSGSFPYQDAVAPSFKLLDI